ncbi:MAG: Hsp20/alpha crystallin family protein [Bacteroidetes bacterium]|nr:Hsp20/alpha crystallin family protein [Bacteroidota bacterium]
MDEFLNNSTKLQNKKAQIPAVNVQETDENFHIEVRIPGFEKEQIKVKADKGILQIHASQSAENKEDSAKYHMREFYTNTYERNFTLPENVNQDLIKAEYKNGILFINIPKKEKENLSIKEINIL